MKTIYWLNEKLWYRLLKTIFVVVFILFILATVLFVGNETKPKTYEDFKITCNYGNKSSYFAHDNGIFIDRNFNPLGLGGLSRLSDSAKERMSALCENTKDELIEVATLVLSEQDPEPLYKVEKEKYTEGNWLRFSFYILFTLIILLILFEFIRRSFYYVIFGTIKPTKK